MRALLLAGLLAGLAAAQAPPADFIRVTQADAPPPLAALLARLETPRLTAHLAYLTDPAREGRSLGTRGLDATVRYLEDQMKTLGLPPLGPGYRQAVPLREVRPSGGAVTLRIAGKALAFRGGKEAVLPAVAPGAFSAPLVFAGHGIQEPALGHDDFKGLDVGGKAVVFLAGVPPGAEWRTPERLDKYASERPADRYDARLALLEKLGARAAIAVEEGLADRLGEGKEVPGPYFLPAPGVPGSGEPPLARIALTPALRASLTASATGAAAFDVRGSVRALRGHNVLARLEGSDPALRREAVVIGAHMDHLGKPGGVVHPGADDNASGVAALLEMARALAAGPRPRRSVVFAFWTGEEEGKFGSGHYVRHPRWPLAATSAYLNLDMIGHPWTLAEIRALGGDPAFAEGLDPAAFAEVGLAAGAPELGPVLARAGRSAGMSLHLDWTDGRNGGSDYRDFARRGRPFVRFFGNFFPGYHRPEDSLDRLDPEQVRRMATLALAAAWLIADR